jgi:hypothetical protein
MADQHGPENDEPLHDLENELRREDPEFIQRMSGPQAGWVARRCLMGFAVAVAGAALLVIGHGALGIGAVILGAGLLFMGGYELTMRIIQLQRIRRANH